MKKDMLRNVLSIIVGFIVLWYCGAMFNFFPFLGDDLVINAIGFTGLLLCVVITVCAYWIIIEINKKSNLSN